MNNYLFLWQYSPHIFYYLHILCYHASCNGNIWLNVSYGLGLSLLSSVEKTPKAHTTGPMFIIIFYIYKLWIERVADQDYCIVTQQFNSHVIAAINLLYFIPLLYPLLSILHLIATIWQSEAIIMLQLVPEASLHSPFSSLHFLGCFFWFFRPFEGGGSQAP